MRKIAFGLAVMLAGCQAPQTGSSSGADENAPDRFVTYERLVNADAEPENWLTYSGQYNGHRYSALDQIDRANADELEIEWVYQFHTLSVVETTPIVVDGMMFITESPSTLIVLDAATGRPYWKYEHPVPEKLTLCCGQNNRGVGVLGDRVFMGTVDGRLIAFDSRTGSILWNVEVGRAESGFSITSAPLVVKDMVITGVGGGEYGVRGYLDAYDAETGERRWRTYSIPAEGEPGNETWGGDSWMYGGAPTWLTGSFDPETNLVYWGTGNPGPDWNGDVRPGDNLYSDAVLAVDVDAGELAWAFQFTPHDTHDWDATQIPVLVDMEWEGEPRKLMLWANRNAFYYVLDRETGEYLHATEFAKQTWAEGIDENGRPILIPNMDPTEEGVEVYPSISGATNWNSPSFSPATGLFYTFAADAGQIYYKRDDEYVEGDLYLGGFGEDSEHPDNFTAAIRALDPLTGNRLWEYELDSTKLNWYRAGILTTAGGLLFSGSSDGYFFALDDRSGADIWHMNVGGPVHAGPMSFAVDGRQYVSISANQALFTFALPD